VVEKTTRGSTTRACTTRPGVRRASATWRRRGARSARARRSRRLEPASPSAPCSLPPPLSLPTQTRCITNNIRKTLYIEKMGEEREDGHGCV
jgi:hypothetical protein